MVPGTRVYLCCGVRRQAARSQADRAYRPLRLQAQLLLRLHLTRSSAVPMLTRQEVAKEVRGRQRDRELDISQYEGMPEVLVNYREEWRLQSHDVQKVQKRILLDLHGSMV